MLKLAIRMDLYAMPFQPPSGGCVLKLGKVGVNNGPLIQPPSGGCVLKPARGVVQQTKISQPPSGGCVLKHFNS